MSSPECRALVNCTDKMIPLLSADLGTVTTKLFTKKLIHSPTSAQHQTLEEGASQLVKKIIDQVKVFPEKFETFLAVLNEILTLQDLATLIEKECKKEATMAESKEMSPFSDSSDSKGQALLLKAIEKFPYLNAEMLTKKEKEELEVRLEMESDEMQDNFASLVDRARESLEKHNITCNDLHVFAQHLSSKSRLIPLIRKAKSIKKLFLKLSEYWTFFDYDFLKHIIERYCVELTPALDEYVSSFKEYSKRRLCELPAGVFEKKGDGYNLYVKIDRHFQKTTVEDLKKLQYRLCKLLGTQLYLLKIEEGCIELVFTFVCDISAPLTPDQVKILRKEMNVLRLYNDIEEYLSYSDDNMPNDMHEDNFPLKKMVHVETADPNPVYKEVDSSKVTDQQRSQQHNDGKEGISSPSKPTTGSFSNKSDANPEENGHIIVSPPFEFQTRVYDAALFDSIIKEETSPKRTMQILPEVYKLYMDQHVKYIFKERQRRMQRKMKLEVEMAKRGLDELTSEQMRRILYKKESNFLRFKRAKMHKDMFKTVKPLGIGTFGVVSLVRQECTNNLYAMKTLIKSNHFHRNLMGSMKAELNILAEANNEWVAKLFFSFEDVKNLYFVMEYVPGGNLMSLLNKLHTFPEHFTLFYSAELISAVESVHEMGFIHQNIKPDNVLIGSNGHIKLTDFGLYTGFLCTNETREENDLVAEEHDHSIAHSLNYTAPEILRRDGDADLCDWWSVGVIMYEMMVGQPPFKAPTSSEKQNKIINWPLHFHIPSQAAMSLAAANLISRFCCNPIDRIGKNGTEEIKSHPFFSAIDWSVGIQNYTPPYIPYITDDTKGAHFTPTSLSQLQSKKPPFNERKNGQGKRKKLTPTISSNSRITGSSSLSRPSSSASSSTTYTDSSSGYETDWRGGSQRQPTSSSRAHLANPEKLQTPILSHPNLSTLAERRHFNSPTSNTNSLSDYETDCRETLEIQLSTSPPQNRNLRRLPCTDGQPANPTFITTSASGKLIPHPVSLSGEENSNWKGAPAQRPIFPYAVQPLTPYHPEENLERQRPTIMNSNDEGLPFTSPTPSAYYLPDYEAYWKGASVRRTHSQPAKTHWAFIPAYVKKQQNPASSSSYETDWTGVAEQKPNISYIAHPSIQTEHSPFTSPISSSSGYYQPDRKWIPPQPLPIPAYLYSGPYHHLRRTHSQPARPHWEIPTTRQKSILQPVYV